MNTNTPHAAFKSRTVIVLISASIALGGCATFSKDGGFGAVQETAKKHIKQEVVWPKTESEKNKVTERVNELLSKRLDVEQAVQIAILNNKGLQADFYNLGISEADLVQAGRLPNPKFSMLYTRNDGDYKIEQILTFNIFSLITMPKMQEIERQRFVQTQKKTAFEVIKIANHTRIAYFNAVAATEQVRYSEQVKESAEASAELARSMVKAGNFNKLQQAREQNFYADAALDYANAKNKQVSAYEALSRLLGVSIDQLILEERLPDLPKSLTELQPFEKAAFEQRLDLQAIRLETDALAKQLGLTKTTRFINVLEIGPARVLEGPRSEPYKKGVELSFELPIFDWGTARVALAESIYMQSVNRAAQLAINAQSEIREAYNTYRTNYDMTKHIRDEIVPLRKKILQENQLRYNGMLISPFELFGDARAQVTSVQSYIESLREFWVADSALQMTLIGNENMMEGN
ncbi:TolC family protein [Methylotenera mobilis]|uniref:TolC family protein n=1 Tax=Methylotenera mobilis TaxID=359408 RepID=UPI00036B3B5D|nr:TolC family protein [Methylotenera mobilis]PPC93282.1 MAG: TolC family protein [Methylotenera sp.]